MALVTVFKIEMQFRACCCTEICYTAIFSFAILSRNFLVIAGASRLCIIFG